MGASVSYDPSLFWQKKPSLKLCAVECGAQCCKDKQVPLSEEEVKQLSVLDPRAHLRMKMNGDCFMLTEARCVFLTKKDDCRIHGVRPKSCRTFPSMPFEFCAVWGG